MVRFVDPRSLTVLITGGTAGFGEAAARRFLGQGSRVIVTGRRQDRLHKLAKVRRRRRRRRSLVMVMVVVVKDYYYYYYYY